MKRILIFLLLLIIGTSCVTQKRCNEKFPQVASTIIKDSIVYRDSIIYKPIIVEVKIPGDTVTKETIVYLNKGLVNSFPLIAETTFAKAIAQVVNSKLTLNLYQKDTTYNQRYDSVVKEAYYWKERYNSKEVTKVVEKKVIPKFYIWMSVIAGILITYHITRIIIKLR